MKRLIALEALRRTQDVVNKTINIAIHNINQNPHCPDECVDVWRDGCLPECKRWYNEEVNCSINKYLIAEANEKN